MRTTITLDNEAAELLAKYSGKYKIKSILVNLAIKYYLGGEHETVTDREMMAIGKAIMQKEET